MGGGGGRLPGGGGGRRRAKVCAGSAALDSSADSAGIQQVISDTLMLIYRVDADSFKWSPVICPADT